MHRRVASSSLQPEEGRTLGNQSGSQASEGQASSSGVSRCSSSNGQCQVEKSRRGAVIMVFTGLNMVFLNPISPDKARAARTDSVHANKHHLRISGHITGG